MDIRPIDAAALADDAVMRDLYDVGRRAQLHGREHMPFWPFPEFLGAMRSPDSGERQELFAAYDGTRMVGSAFLWTPLLDNTEKAFIEVAVDVPERRRGIGRALAEHVVGLARGHGRTLVMIDAHLPYTDRETHANARFAEALGFGLSNYEVVRQLPLPVPDERIGTWIDEAAPKHAGYAIETYVGAVPDELVASLCVLIGQLSVDAPTGATDFEEEVMTPERYVDWIASSTAMGRDRYETVAVTPDREVVAQSTLAVSFTGNPVVYQWGTFVHREHRGHALGLATKAVNLRAVQAARDDLRLVTTQNAETNEHMVAINERMGFRPVEVAAEFVRHL